MIAIKVIKEWVPLVEQELLTLREHLSSSPVFSGVRLSQSVDLCVCFVNRCLFFCTFSFGHSVVFLSSIYGFWFPLVSSNSSYLGMETIAIKQFFTWVSHQDFLVRQELLVLKLKLSLRRSTVAIMVWLTVMVYLCQRWPRYVPFVVVNSSLFVYHRICNLRNMIGVINEAWTIHTSRATDVVPGFNGVCVVYFRLITCIQSSFLSWYPLRFPLQKYVRFVFNLIRFVWILFN
jgi:hypothetical protein